MPHSHPHSHSDSHPHRLMDVDVMNMAGFGDPSSAAGLGLQLHAVGQSSSGEGESRGAGGLDLGLHADPHGGHHHQLDLAFDYPVLNYLSDGSLNDGEMSNLELWREPGQSSREKEPEAPAHEVVRDILTEDDYEEFKVLCVGARLSSRPTRLCALQLFSRMSAFGRLIKPSPCRTSKRTTCMRTTTRLPASFVL